MPWNQSERLLLAWGVPWQGREHSCPCASESCLYRCHAWYIGLSGMPEIWK